MLITPDTVAVPQIGCLKNPIHLNKVRRQSNEVISAVYKQLYEHVHNPDNEYDDPSVLMSRTPDLVYQILVNGVKPLWNRCKLLLLVLFTYRLTVKKKHHCAITIQKYISSILFINTKLFYSFFLTLVIKVKYVFFHL